MSSAPGPWNVGSIAEGVAKDPEAVPIFNVWFTHTITLLFGRMIKVESELGDVMEDFVDGLLDGTYYDNEYEIIEKARHAKVETR